MNANHSQNPKRLIRALLRITPSIHAGVPQRIFDLGDPRRIERANHKSAQVIFNFQTS